MATDTVTIEQFVTDARITLSCVRTDNNPHGMEDMDHWKVTMNRPLEVAVSSHRAFDVYLNGKQTDTVFSTDEDPEDVKRSLVGHDGYDPAIVVRKRRIPRSARMTLTFSKGYGHRGAEPTATEVLSCLADDAAGIENSPNFEDWCSEYGYDTDSRKAEKSFKACEHQAARLRTFLGDELYDQLLWKVGRE